MTCFKYLEHSFLFIYRRILVLYPQFTLKKMRLSKFLRPLKCGKTYEKQGTFPHFDSFINIFSFFFAEKLARTGYSYIFVHINFLTNKNQNYEQSRID